MQFIARLVVIGIMVMAARHNLVAMQRAFPRPSILSDSPAMIALGTISAICRQYENSLNPGA